MLVHIYMCIYPCVNIEIHSFTEIMLITCIQDTHNKISTSDFSLLADLTYTTSDPHDCITFDQFQLQKPPFYSLHENLKGQRFIRETVLIPCVLLEISFISKRCTRKMKWATKNTGVTFERYLRKYLLSKKSFETISPQHYPTPGIFSTEQ